MDTRELHFVLERETKNTVRYQEQTNGQSAVIGTVSRSRLGANPPANITVTIAESHSGA